MLYLLVLFFLTSNIIQAFPTISLSPYFLTHLVKQVICTRIDNTRISSSEAYYPTSWELPDLPSHWFPTGHKITNTNFLMITLNFIKKLYYLLYRMKKCKFIPNLDSGKSIHNNYNLTPGWYQAISNPKWNMQDHPTYNVAHISALNAMNKTYTQRSMIYESHLQF